MVLKNNAWYQDQLNTHWDTRAKARQQLREFLQEVTDGAGMWTVRDIGDSRTKLPMSSEWIDQLVEHEKYDENSARAISDEIGGTRTLSPRGFVETVLRTLGARPLPPVVTIPAFRRLAELPAEMQGHTPWHDGRGLIEELRNLENPTAENEENLVKWAGIQDFVRTILNDDGITLTVPSRAHTINVRRGSKLLPLENQGTGIHEVVVLAAAATLLEDHLVCIEEPEVHLHPLLQRQLLRYLDERTSNQYLIATHSAHLIDTDLASVYHVTLTDEGSTITAVQDGGAHSTLVSDLGYRASDLVQANAIIWVEGPSDRIYVRHWLQLADPNLIEGLHYSIMFYGGRLLNHLSVQDSDVQDFIELQRMNRRVAILIDSDKTHSRQRINETKKRIRDEMRNGQGIAWVTDCYTIENYVPFEHLEAAIIENHPGYRVKEGGPWDNPLGSDLVTNRRKGKVRVDKIELARSVVERWTDTSGRPRDLDRKVSELLAFVHAANGITAAPVKRPSR